MPHRTLCQVLEEMRQCYETRNFAHLNGLIEEAQSMGNRMEARIYEIHDFESYTKKVKALREELKTLREEKAEITGDKVEREYFFD